MARAEARLSAYEAAALEWYLDEVNPFARKHGLVREYFLRLGLEGDGKRLFYKAVNMIQSAFPAASDKEE